MQPVLPWFFQEHWPNPLDTTQQRRHDCCRQTNQFKPDQVWQISAILKSISWTAMATVSVTVSNNGSIALGSVSGSKQDLTVSANGTVTDLNGFSVRNVALSGNASSGSSAIILNNATATNSATLTTTGGGDLLGSISTPTLIEMSAGVSA